MWQLPNVADVGITPACAGKMRRDRAHRCGRRDPPRLCGEKMFCRAASAAPIGSPPLTRGKVWRWRSSAPRPGITPAYAGKSFRGAAVHHGAEDHPRLRGEKFRSRFVLYPAAGSPPLTRGKACHSRKLIPNERITPAYAGKRLARPCAGNYEKDHPRLRGEKLISKNVLGRQLGSPPLTRGKVFSYYDGRTGRRITPAYAGKSCNAAYNARRSWDHPRLRGEKT